MGRTAYPGLVLRGASLLRRAVAARRVLSDRERGRRRDREREGGGVPPCLRAPSTYVSPPRGRDFLRSAEPVERITLVVVARRVLDVIAKLGEQPVRRAAACACGELGEVVVAVHASSTACTLAVKFSQSRRRPSSALRPCAVSS